MKVYVVFQVNWDAQEWAVEKVLQKRCDAIDYILSELWGLGVDLRDEELSEFRLTGKWECEAWSYEIVEREVE